MKTFKKVLSLLSVTAILSQTVISQTTEVAENTNIHIQALSNNRLSYSISEYEAHILNSTDDILNIDVADLNDDNTINVMDMIRYKQSVIQLAQNTETAFDLANIQAYENTPYTVVNNNTPYFDIIDKGRKNSFEEYSPLDSLGRCGEAYACVGEDIMPTEPRGEIGNIKPTGWHTVKYDNVSGKYLYNRCHLLGYQLTGENANERNLITGTRYLNIEGMLPFENMVADYIKETHNHVLYRVTPIFSSTNLLSNGVLMEALSVEDNGEAICFNVFAYNVQPDIEINYADGESWSLLTPEPESTTVTEITTTTTPTTVTTPTTTIATVPNGIHYVLNTSTKKFHLESCGSVKLMSDANRLDITGNRDDIISQGYQPCKKCNP